MEHHYPGVLPSNAPALPEADSSIPSRALQERSGNRRNGYSDSSSSWKRSPSSPIENVYSHGPGSGYFTSNLTAQLSGEKSEAQIERETQKLWAMLQRCEKYQKYRDRQPKNAKERKQKWPEHLEYAFFKGLVRWPPMGRRKHLLDGQLRGRNELVADSIFRDTGELRIRKQVSSHIQVLKNYLSGHPQLLVHMSKEDLGGRKGRHPSSHFSHLRSRHQPYSHASKQELSSQAGSNVWQGDGSVPSSHLLTRMQSNPGTGLESPYTVTNFAMVIHDNKKEPIHYYTQVADNSRLGDLSVTNTTSWHKQYPELNFHRTEELKGRQVLVCDASIKIMTEIPHTTDELAIDFVLRSNNDLSILEPLQCRTRFYDSGQLAGQYDETKQKYEADTSRVFVPFGSGFWVQRMTALSKRLREARMHDEQGTRGIMEANVRRSLQYMTAVQDMYSIESGTGEEHCFLTILWRFHQTKNSSEPGRMHWRVVNFGPPVEPSWMKAGEMDTIKDPKALIGSMTSAPSTTLYPSISLEFHPQPFIQHPDLDDLSTIALEGMTDYSQPNSATAPSMTTDYSQAHSLPSLSHSQDAGVSQSQQFHDPNEFDFNGGHINITGCLEPAINLGAYENYTTRAPSLAPINSMTGLEHVHGDNGYGDLDMGFYAPKPSWHYTDLISRLDREGMAEQAHGMLDQTTHGQDIVGHGVLHDGQLGHGMWKLQQSTFADDMGIGADHGAKGEPLSQEHGPEIFDMIERGQRAREDNFRAY